MPTQLADGWCDPSGRPAGHGHVRNLGSLRQGLHHARQEEEIRDESASQDAESSFQRIIRLQGI